MSFSVRVARNTLDGLDRDLTKLPVRATRDMKAKVREAAIVGNTVAKDFAKSSAGSHGKHYSKAFTWETSSFVGFGGAAFSAEYGPDIARPQGGMEFEMGSRNQKPHLDLARSADLIGPTFAREAAGLADGWFW